MKTWETVKNKTYQKIPTWITPIDAYKQQNLINWKQIRTYKEFLRLDETLRTNQELEELDIKLTWWERLQLETQYNKD